MKKKLQVFISSTYSDLKEDRQAAVGAILKAGHLPAGMELFTAGDESQMETIKRWIDESDVYMLILGGRYGSVEKTTALSYTELEYDYAVANEKPFFAVVINEKALDKRVKEHGADVLELEHPQELKLFREKVLSKMSSFFEDAKDIKLAVHETMSDFESRHELKGWVRGDEVPDTKPLFEEISILRAQNVELNEQVTSLTKRFEQTTREDTKENEFKDLLKLLYKIEIETKVLNEPGDEEAKKIPLYNFFSACKDDLVTGVTNQMGTTDLHSLLYFNVCPKLQIHGLVVNEKVPSVRWRRFSLTKKGMDLLAYIDKLELLKGTKK